MFASKVVLLFLIYNCFSLALQETVKVSLYYEALCPHSIDFFIDQLYPGYEVLGDSLTIELIPYGKSKHRKVHGKWQLTCQHGPKECYANTIQGCILSQNYTQEENMNYIGCLMATGHPQRNSNARKCANKSKLPWKTIKACANGEEGKEIFAHFGDITDNLDPQLTYVPYILFDDVHNGTLEDSARENFLKTVCSLYEEKPNGC